MSLKSGVDGYGAGGPAGASVGAMPALTSGAAYTTWAPLFLNYCASNGLGDVLRKDIPDWRGKCAMAEAWADEADNEMYAAATAASGSSTPPVKQEDAKTALAAAETRAARAGVLKKINDSRRVYGALFRTLPEGLRAQIPTDEGHAFALWRWLENKFQSKEADSIGALWSEWVKLSMGDGEDFDAYRARVNKLHTLLSSAKETVTPAFYAFTLLDRLQPRYLAAVLALRTSKEEHGLKDPSKTDWDEVAKIINAHERHEQRLNGSTGDDDTYGLERALAAVGNQQRSKQTFSSNSRWSPPEWMKGVRCYACKELGHTTKFCPNTQQLEKWLAEKKQQSSKESVAAALQWHRHAEEEEEDHTGEEYAFSVVSAATKQASYTEWLKELGVPMRAAPRKKQMARRPGWTRRAAAAAAAAASPSNPAAADPQAKKTNRQVTVERATSSSSPRRMQTTERGAQTALPLTERGAQTALTQTEETTKRQQCTDCAGCACMRAKGETPLSDSRTKEIKNGGTPLQQPKPAGSGAGAETTMMKMMTTMTTTTTTTGAKKKNEGGAKGSGSLGDDTLRHVKATSVKSISGVEKTAKGFQPEAMGTKGLEPRDECPTQTLTEVCAGALLLPFQPSQADSCSVELTEGWRRAVY
jgi:hypothetical protein